MHNVCICTCSNEFKSAAHFQWAIVITQSAEGCICCCIIGELTQYLRRLIKCLGCAYRRGEHLIERLPNPALPLFPRPPSYHSGPKFIVSAIFCSLPQDLKSIVREETARKLREGSIKGWFTAVWREASAKAVMNFLF